MDELWQEPLISQGFSGVACVRAATLGRGPCEIVIEEVFFTAKCAKFKKREIEMGEVKVGMT
jgi:hypothetical protein